MSTTEKNNGKGGLRVLEGGSRLVTVGMEKLSLRSKWYLCFVSPNLWRKPMRKIEKELYCLNVGCKLLVFSDCVSW